ncbi:pilus assembly protein TadG-related protein [Sinomonas sp. JGH33]|uniref:Pilus assembly protein TadG-related protein n=1 Tax=Sinomonas terricola TaxID=3110330 RepID=A0ABU5TCX4_9MICC|nr:pilus assembly protein TadG-related protein [Sinomonas sp. JGH33]MEA5457301.1 pilus assembly protein TadG-related protein [Sinomonas sp. JGH33]
MNIRLTGSPGAEHRERGSATLLMVITFIGLLLAVGLVVDGGQKIAADREARNIAEAAARAGANAVGGNAVAGGTPTIDLQTGAARARSYIAAAGVQGSVSAAGDTLTVTVTSSRPAIILAAIGIPKLTSTTTTTSRVLKQ